MLAGQRGNPDLLKSIQQSAKKVSEANGLSNIGNTQTVSRANVTPTPLNEADIMKQMNGIGGSYTIPKDSPIFKSQYSTVKSNPVGYDFQKTLFDRLTESIQSVGTTKEYFNAVSSLFTLYALGQLNEDILNQIDREDLREIRGIIREFKSVIDTH